MNHEQKFEATGPGVRMTRSRTLGGPASGAGMSPTTPPAFSPSIEPLPETQQQVRSARRPALFSQFLQI